MNLTIPLNDGWQFTEQCTKGLWETKYSGPALRNVRLPHTVKELPFDYFSEELYQMEAGYRRNLQLPAEWAESRMLLRFDGVAHRAEVYLNGRSLAVHSCGYTAFTVDITDFAGPGRDNILAVRVDCIEDLNIPPFGGAIDFLTYGGIYREVFLLVRPHLYIEDIFAACGESGGEAVLECTVSVNKPAPDGAAVRLTVTSDKGELLLESAAKVEGAKAEFSSAVPGAALWRLDAPNLCTVTAELSLHGVALDSGSVRAGFRSAVFRADGFYLNGEKIKLIGLSRHQSYPYVGYAMPERPQKLDADIAKYELGLNFVRTSHYPQSHHFIDRCDEIGLLVFTEIPGWQFIGDHDWKDQAVQNTREMVRQYRRHPSIVLWGVRINESPDDDPLYKQTNAVARRLDPSRQTGGVRNISKSRLLEDVYTYNDFSHSGKNAGCEKKKRVTGRRDVPYLITEYCGHMYPAKSGDPDRVREAHALRHAAVLDAAAKETGAAGCAGWCMTDYNTHREFGSGDMICHHGVTDMFRNPKYAAAVYRSQGGGAALEITGGLFGGDFPQGALLEIWALTNADSVRLYRDGVFAKEFFPGKAFRNLPHPPIQIDDFIGEILEKEEGISGGAAKLIKKIMRSGLLYGSNPGALPVIDKLRAALLLLFFRIPLRRIASLARKATSGWATGSHSFRFDAVKDGEVTVSVVKEPVKSKSLLLIADTNALTENGCYDVASVRFRAVDQNGNTLSFCNDAIQLFVTGPLEIIGPFVVPLRGGMGGCFLKTTGKPGKGTLVAVGGGLGTRSVSFEVEIKDGAFRTYGTAFRKM